MSNIAPYGSINKEFQCRCQVDDNYPGDDASISNPGVFLSSSHGANHRINTFDGLSLKSSVAFYWQHLTARCYGIPYPGLNGAGRQGESRYAKSITPIFSNKFKQNSSYNKVILVMTLPIGGEVKWLVIQYGYFKLKDNWASLLVGVGGHRYQAVA